MSKLAFLFPGQASQYPGMGKDLAANFPESRAVFDEADATLGFPLSKMCFEGTEDELVLTEDAFELAGLAADGRPYVFAGAGHFLNLDQPDEFDAMIAESLGL